MEGACIADDMIKMGDGRVFLVPAYCFLPQTNRNACPPVIDNSACEVHDFVYTHSCNRGVIQSFAWCERCGRDWPG